MRGAAEEDGARPEATTVTVTFAPTAASVGGARRFVRQLVAEWGHAPLLDVAELCISELVTNAIGHTAPSGAPITVRVTRHATGVRIEVQDQDGAHLPELRQRDVDRIGGRGLVLIDAMSDEWGHVLDGNGKLVWIELRADQDRAP